MVPIILILTALAVLVWWWMRESPPTITQYSHLPTPPRLSFGEVFSLMRQASKEKKGFLETVQQKHGDLVWIRVPLFRNLALLTSPQYAKQFFAAKEADFLQGFRVRNNYYSLISINFVGHAGDYRFGIAAAVRGEVQPHAYLHQGLFN